MRILVSGFEAFGPNAINPTERLALDVVKNPSDYLPSAPRDLHAVVLPVTFADAYQVLSSEIASFKPDAVLALGLAGGRSLAIELERVAINCIDCDIPDNSGRVLRDEKIEEKGASAHFSTLPLREMLGELERSGVPAKISNTAGTYVCNFLFYRLQERARARISGFVHIPFLPEQIVGQSPIPPSMEFDVLKKGLVAMITAIHRVGKGA